MSPYIPILGIMALAGGFLVLTESDFNAGANGVNAFSLNSHGDDLILSSATLAGDLTGYADAIRFGASPNGIGFGRWTNSVGDVQFVLQSQNSPGALNEAPLAHKMKGGKTFVERAAAAAAAKK